MYRRIALQLDLVQPQWEIIVATGVVELGILRGYVQILVRKVLAPPTIRELMPTLRLPLARISQQNLKHVTNVGDPTTLPV